MKDLSTTIQQHSAALRSRHPAVRECRVNIEDRPPHLYECRRFNVRLDIAIDGHEIVVNREHDDDPAAGAGGRVRRRAPAARHAAGLIGAGRRAHAAHRGMRKAARTGAPAAAGR